MISMQDPIRARFAAIVLGAAALATLPGVAAAQTNTKHRVRFQRGRTTAVLQGAVVRGDRESYVLEAKAGQRMIVHITSLEKNAVFTVYSPPPRKPLRRATERTDWTGRLPRSGDYVIEVGGTRGNASYTLEVTIR